MQRGQGRGQGGGGRGGGGGGGRGGGGRPGGPGGGMGAGGGVEIEITIDPGRVGAVTQVNPDIIRRLVADGFIPVIAPVAVDAEGKSIGATTDADGKYSFTDVLPGDYTVVAFSPAAGGRGQAAGALEKIVAACGLAA